MSASRVVRNGAATRFTRRVILATVTSLVLTATACSGQAGVKETAADGSGALDKPAQTGDRPSPTPTGTALRRDGEVITYTGGDPWSEGDLVAQDPDTGEVRTLVAFDVLGRHLLPSEVDLGLIVIGSAAWSAAGRWVAFEVVGWRRPKHGRGRDGGALGHERAGRASAVDEAVLRGPGCGRV